MKGVFADTAYWIAISNLHDSLHDRARQISRSLPLSTLVVTNEMVSFRIMEQYGIREALTYDRHFGQAGFKALLRDD